MQLAQQNHKSTQHQHDDDDDNLDLGVKFTMFAVKGYAVQE